MPPGGIADVALEDADRVRNGERRAFVCMHRGGQEGGVGRAIDAGPERRKEDAKSVFAAVHVCPPVPAVVRVHVGHEDFRQVRLVEDAAPALALAHVYVGQNDARPLVHPCPEAPDVPGDQSVLDGDVGSARLRECGRTGCRTQGTGTGLDLGLAVAPAVLGHGTNAGVEDLDHIAGVQVDHRIKPLDRLGVEIRALRQNVTGNLHQAPAIFLGKAETSGRQRQAEHLLGGEAALFKAGDEGRVAGRKLHRGHELGEQDHRFAAGRLHRHDPVAGKVDLGDEGSRVVLEMHFDRARLRVALPPCKNDGLLRLFQ